MKKNVYLRKLLIALPIGISLFATGCGQNMVDRTMENQHSLSNNVRNVANEIMENGDVSTNDFRDNNRVLEHRKHHGYHTNRGGRADKELDMMTTNYRNGNEMRDNLTFSGDNLAETPALPLQNTSSLDYTNNDDFASIHNNNYGRTINSTNAANRTNPMNTTNVGNTSRKSIKRNTSNPTDNKSTLSNNVDPKNAMTAPSQYLNSTSQTQTNADRIYRYA